MTILTDRDIIQLCTPRQTLSLETTTVSSEEPGLLADEIITGARYGVSEDWKPMLDPFIPNQVREVDGHRTLSFGLSSMGYDARLSDHELKLFTNVHGAEIDPMDLNVEQCFITPEIRTDARTGLKYVLIPPNSYLLGHTVEYFRMPRDVLSICVGKSTTARAATLVNVTPIEPGFEGVIVIELANLANLPLRVYLNVGVAQFMFFRSSAPCAVSYADRVGK